MFERDGINVRVSRLLVVVLIVCGLFVLKPCEAKSTEQETTKNKESKNPELYDYELFKLVQKMHNVIEPDPNPYWYQTKKGLLIEGHRRLLTPWGDILLTGVGSLESRQKLFQRLKTTFKCINKDLGMDDDVVRFYVFKSNDTDLRTAVWGDVSRKVSRQEVEKMKGQDIFVVSSHCGYEPIYEIHEIDGVPLPKTECLKRPRDYDEVKLAWKELKKRFQDEQREKKKRFREEEWEKKRPERLKEGRLIEAVVSQASDW